MAYSNKTIRNSVTGQDIRFLQTARDTYGQLLEMESTYQPQSMEPAPHYHPYQVEDFRVLSGEITVRIEGQEQVLKQGDIVHIPKNKVHSMWNDSAEEAVVNWQVRPALETEYLLETAAGLANDGKTNAAGMPSILQVALMASRYDAEFRLARPPYFVQRVLFLILTPFAYLAGYQPTYEPYLA
jgi:quercetin dioxygenase-like cupin family protein